MLVKEGVSVELLEKVERNVRFVFFPGLPDYSEVALESDRVYLVSHGFKRRDDVVLRSPRLLLYVDAIVESLRWHQLMRQQHQNAEFCLGFESHSGIRW